MTAKELIKRLSNLPKDKLDQQVFFIYEDEFGEALGYINSLQADYTFVDNNWANNGNKKHKGIKLGESK